MVSDEFIDTTDFQLITVPSYDCKVHGSVTNVVGFHNDVEQSSYFCVECMVGLLRDNIGEVMEEK